MFLQNIAVSPMLNHIGSVVIAIGALGTASFGKVAPSPARPWPLFVPPPLAKWPSSPRVPAPSAGPLGTGWP